MKVFWPLTTYWLPVIRAVVRTAWRSEPVPGSVMAMAADQFAGRHLRQPAAFLLFRAVGQDVLGDDAAVHGVAEAADIGPALFIQDDRFVGESAAGATVFLRDAGQQQAGLARLVPTSPAA